jgi:hypothetical protein
MSRKSIGLTGGVHDAIQILILALDLYIGLVGAIAFVGRFQMGTTALVQHRCIGLYPTPKAAGVHLNPTLPQSSATCS